MSAPKPRVRVVSGSAGQAWFQWCCPCEDEGLPPGFVRAPRVVNFSLADALEEAIAHSRTHTAERIADELLHLSECALDDHDRGDELAPRHAGRASAFTKSALFVRKHLVGRSS